MAASLHPSEYKILPLTATPGSILDLYRLLLADLHIEKSSTSRAVLTRLIQQEIRSLYEGKKIKPVLIIDEASLLRLEVLAELHLLTQFDQDSKPYLPIILAGQSPLVDQLVFRTSRPLASRIIARCHLQGVSRQEMADYLVHHLTLAGLKTNPLEEAAITAIQQGSGGLFRKANHLARGALIAAAAQQSLGRHRRPRPSGRHRNLLIRSIPEYPSGVVLYLGKVSMIYCGRLYKLKNLGCGPFNQKS